MAGITGLKKMRIARRGTRKTGMMLYESIPLGTVYLVVPSRTRMLQACAHPTPCPDPRHYEIGIAAIQQAEQATGDWSYLPLDLLEDVPEQVN